MRSFYRARSRLGPNRRRATRRAGDRRRVILLYHRVAAPAHDPFALAVRPAWFQDHLDILSARSKLVTLDEILSSGAPDGGVRASITFDDGYLDNLLTASPALQEAKVPATFFICTGSLGDPRGFWWDRLASAIAAAEGQAAVLGRMDAGLPAVDLMTEDARSKATLELAARLQPMHPVARDQLLTDLETELTYDGAPVHACPILDEAGVRDLGSQPLTELGAHTHNHPMLSQLTREEQLAEITQSIEALRSITGVRPRFGAYPYGGELDYNDDSCLAAEDADLSAAFVNHAGRFDPESRPYLVPRYYVPPLPADRFRTWLDGILAA